MSSPLFRREALTARSARLLGDIMVVPSATSAVLTLAVASVAAAALTFAATATYARTEQVGGVVTSRAPLAKVVAPRPGVVAALLVREGDLVIPGQPLAEIRVEQFSRTGIATATAGIEALATQRRLAERQLALEPARVAAEQRRLNAQIDGAKGQLAEIERQLTLQADLVKSARVAVDQAETLIARGFATRTDLERRRQDWLSAEQARRQLAQSRTALAAQSAAAEAELARLPIDAANAAMGLETSLAQIAAATAQQTNEQGYRLAAPIGGRVTAVQIAAGRFADGRVPLLTIVPEGAKMGADLFAPSRAMGFVRPRDEVRLMYDAFPYQRFGSFRGRVEQVSRTVIAPGEVDAPIRIDVPVYRIRVALSDQAVKGYGIVAPLQPGMTLRATIVLERRTFLDWLLDPVRAVRNRTR